MDCPGGRKRDSGLKNVLREEPTSSLPCRAQGVTERKSLREGWSQERLPPHGIGRLLLKTEK